MTASLLAFCRCNHMIGRIIAAPHDASVIQLMDDISDEVSLSSICELRVQELCV